MKKTVIDEIKKYVDENVNIFAIDSLSDIVELLIKYEESKKEAYKQEIIEAFNEGWADMSSGNCLTGEQYYKETYLNE